MLLLRTIDKSTRLFSLWFKILDVYKPARCRSAFLGGRERVSLKSYPLWSLSHHSALFKHHMVTSQCKGQRVQLWKEQLASGRVWSPAEKKKEIPNFSSFQCQLNIFWCRNLSGGAWWIPVKWQFRQSVSGWKGCIDWSPTGPSDISSQKRAVSIQIHNGVHLWPCRPPRWQVAEETELPFPVDSHSEGHLRLWHVGFSYAWKKRLWNWSSQHDAFEARMPNLLLNSGG